MEPTKLSFSEVTEKFDALVHVYMGSVGIHVPQNMCAKLWLEHRKAVTAMFSESGWTEADWLREIKSGSTDS